MSTAPDALAGTPATRALPAPVSVGELTDTTIEAMRARGVIDPERWGRTLVAAALDVPSAELDTLRRRPPTPEQLDYVRDILGRVTPDEPVAYLVGRAPFLGLDFAVTRDTLIPKRDTELFVEIILAEVASDPLPENPHVLELCCGSGCFAITLAKRIPGARVVATDISPEALTVAQKNVATYGADVTLGLGDLWEPVAALMGGRPFDLIVSNPPYIPTEKIPDMGRHVAEHEPHLALDGGADGLDPHRRILERAAEFLAPGGRVFLEHEYYHGEAARALAQAAPDLTDVRTFADANGKDRAVFARRRP
jgi:release factor glutamine methyltransferase